MNSQELRIYTRLTHPAKPESHIISDDGTKLYIMEPGCMAILEGESLDKMTGRELYSWYLSAIRDWRWEHHR